MSVHVEIKSSTNTDSKQEKHTCIFFISFMIDLHEYYSNLAKSTEQPIIPSDSKMAQDSNDEEEEEQNNGLSSDDEEEEEEFVEA